MSKDELVKRAYVKPQILRVQLNNEQAVLSACSVTAAQLNSGTGLFCGPLGTSGGGRGCRRGNAANGDSGATS
jgi:hypothetical protein